jgi:predicted DsbA family dithiol-disulfide isomerase
LAESVPEFMGIGLNLDDNTLIVDTRKADERVLWVVEKGSQIDITDDTRSKYFKEVKGEDVNADENQPSDATSEAAANEAAAVSNDHSA